MRELQRHRAIESLQVFLTTPLDQVLGRHTEVEPEQAALDLFHSVAANVPAYQAFLHEHGIDPATIQTFEDFLKLPHVLKKNYLQRHSLAGLCRHGQLETCDMIAVSSGSTGTPTFWPRFVADELQVATRFEQVFHDSFAADKHRTLAVVCFSLGTWVGGMYTASCCRHLSSKGYPVTVITPGNNREEIFRVVQELGPAFEQVVLLGYPPTLKDIIDVGVARGIAWERYHIKLVMAGEVFSEDWRNLVGARLGSPNPCYDSAALYGTADAGVLANETPLSICIRRFLSSRPDAARALFGESRMPTLAQYDPLNRFFECHDRALIFTGDNGIPLVRYNILDTGGLIPFDTMLDFLADYGFDPIAELRHYGDRGIRPLPFVYVFGRSDFTVSYFGANIYPENVTVGLEQAEVSDWVTGKFVLEVREDADQNRWLAVTVEMAPDEAITEDRRQLVSDSILTQLLRLNSEFANYVPAEYRKVSVALESAGHPEHFPAGVKHRYTRRRT